MNHDGEVHIKEAGILVSWPPDDSKEEKPVLATLRTVWSNATTDEEEVDLRKWLGRFRPQAEKHAVSLSWKGSGCIGIILERIYPANSHGADQFLKIGTFITTLPDSDVGARFDNRSEKNWVVL